MAKFSNFSNLYILFRAVSTVIAEQDTRIEEIINSSFISTAKGSRLDDKARDFGISRLRGTYAIGTCLCKGPSTNLPTGTILQSSDQLLQFKISNTISLPAAIETPIVIEALTTGEAYNLSQGSVLYSNLFPSHTFTIGKYRDPISRVAIGSLSNGSSIESDDDFRNRIKATFSGNLTQKGTLSYIREEVRKLPFISRVYIKEHQPVTGYFSVFVDITDSESIKVITNLIREIKPIGTAFLVRPIRTKPIDVSLEIVVSSSYASTISASIRESLSNYFSNLGLDDTVDPSDINNAARKVLGVNKVKVLSPALPIFPTSSLISDMGTLDISIRVV
jgi:uncharacterized phage protein gp47/JayE